MNDETIKKTLNKMCMTIDDKKHQGVDDGKIRVRMGKHLATRIMLTYNMTLVTSEMNTILGYPIEIDYDNPMCLEVHIVEKVPIVKVGVIDE